MPIGPAAGCRKALRIQSTAMHGRLLLSVLAPLCLWLSGCSAGMAPGPTFMASSGVSGRLMGGQQAISGANIILWMVNTNGSAASSLMTSTVTSQSNGGFTLTGNYSTASCSSTTQVYLTATGGNAGSGNNNSLALMAALGPCLQLAPSNYIIVNEVTTVAAVFALRQFIGATQGTSFAEGIATGTSQQSVQGMINAFQTAQLLANVSTGAANATVGNASIEASKINSLANTIAACVNSTGSSSSNCQNLFSYATPASSPSPVDTIQALLYIAANPANNAALLFGLGTANPPFASALAAAPFDWSLGVTYTGDSLAEPYLLASDATGNIWIAGEKSGAENLIELTPPGSPASGSPFLTDKIDLPQAVVPDTLGNIWMTAIGGSSSTGNRLFSFSPTTATVTGYTLPTSPSNCGPESMAIDGSDDLFFTCTSLGYLYEFPNQTSGTPSATNLPSYPALPTQYGAVGTQDYGMAIDGLGNVWVANTSSSSVTEYAAGAYGTVANTFTPGSEPVGIAIDHGNNVWATSGSSLVEYAYTSGSGYTGNTFSGGGLNGSEYVAVDGAGNLWVANGGATTIAGTQYVSISEFSNSGVALSPAAVSGTSPGGFSHANTASSPIPRGITIDPSGNVWMTGCGLSSSCANSTSFVLEIIGAAQPPVVPLAAALASNQLGCCSFTPTPPSSTSNFAPTINSFTANTTSVTAGHPITLTWNVSGASSVQISGVTASPVSPITVYPDASGSYTLTATNSNGSVSQAIAITVTPAQIASATIGSTSGQLVPSNFMGLGIGPTSWESAFGEPVNGTNTVLRQIINNITQYGASPISYKITAYDQYPASNATYVPTSTQISALNQLYADTGATFYVGVNLAADVPSIAEAQTQAYAEYMTPGSLVGIEIGNEPDNYTPAGYRPNPYYFLEDYANIEPGVLTTLQATSQPSTVKIIGPAWGEPKSLTGGIGNVVNDSGNAIKITDYLNQESSNLSLVTQHGYTDQCTSLNRTSPPDDYLLQTVAQNCATSSYLLAGVAPAHALSLKYRIGETNSITGGGLSGISNTYQASLWIMDYAARLAAGGVDGINIFGDSITQYYTMFTFNQSGGTPNIYTLNYVLPQYYGVLMFQQATQNKAQFLPVTTTATGNQVIYGWLDASNTIRILVLNKDESGSGTVSLTLPAGYGDGTITRLLEAVPNATPAWQSTSGVTLGGQSFDSSVLGTEATNGVIQGNAYGETVVPLNNVYTFSIPVTSAVLLTVPQI